MKVHSPPSKNAKLYWPIAFLLFLVITVSPSLYLYNLHVSTQIDFEQKVYWGKSTHPRAEVISKITHLYELESWESDAKFIEEARELDPENAFVELQAMRLLSEGAFNSSFSKGKRTITILNEELCKKTIESFESFLNKAKYNDYRSETFLELHQEEQSYIGLFREAATHLAIPLPPLSKEREFVFFYLVHDNPSAPALKKRVQNLIHFTKKLIPTSQLLTENFGRRGYAVTCLNYIASLPEDERDQLKEEIKELTFLYRITTSIRFYDSPIPKKNSSILAAAHFSTFLPPDNLKRKLKITGDLEYTHFDRESFNGIALLFSLLSVMLAMIILRWHLPSHDEKPYFFIPDNKYLIKALSVFLISMTLFLLFRSYLPSRADTRNFGMGSNGFLYLTELFSFLIFAIGIPLRIIQNGLHEKLSPQKECPPLKKYAYILLSLPMAIIILGPIIGISFEDDFIVIPISLPAIYILLYTLNYFRLLLKKKYAFWIGCSTRWATLCLLLSGIFLVLCSSTVLKLQETSLYKQENLIKVHHQEGKINCYWRSYALDDVTNKLHTTKSFKVPKGSVFEKHEKQKLKPLIIEYKALKK